MNLKTKRTNLLGILFGGAALASMLGGMVFVDSAVAEELSSKRHRRCFSYTLLNRTNRGIDYNIGRNKSFLPAKGRRSFRRCFRRRVYHPVVKFDKIIGSGYKLATVRLTPGRNGFDRKGRIIVLTSGSNGPVPNALPVPNRKNLD
ncbi:hypothetical protein NIES267_50860 [Calothrix parasitica NIES-267]|uniref:Uncharacterized protein n=1 Tax=Calothrix parasitica NIES-267 TaxID=1973488 RepID=A0A1Z4LWF7_9CYAN|nr:hypothetical protein NIES267_50860 [Calothrix parasitica NIES-267]